MKFFLKLLLGILVGTFFHELYHLFASNGRLIFRWYGVGVQSKGGSSEVIAYTITFIFIILAFYWAVKTDKRKK